MCAGVVPEAGFGRFRRVTVWFVVLQPCQGQPCNYFEDLLVIKLSTWAEPLCKTNDVHVVKHGIRIMLLLLGIPSIFF